LWTTLMFFLLYKLIEHYVLVPEKIQQFLSFPLLLLGVFLILKNEIEVN